MDETNPYASPRCMEPAEPAAPDSEPAEVVAWRQGDVLILPRTAGVLPRACLISNRSTGVRKTAITTFANASAFLLLPLFLVPFVGFLCAAVCGAVLLSVGWAAEIQIWVRWWVAVAFAVCSYWVAIPLAIGGNVLTGIAILGRSMPLLLAGGLCLAVSIAFMVLPLKLLTRFKLDLKRGQFVSIRGVHPGYLDRLPEFPGEEAPS